MQRAIRSIAVLAVSLLFSLNSGLAQNIEEEPEITALMNDYVQHNKLHQRVRGYRVQVIVTTDRRQVESTRTEFRTLYPDYPVYYNHEDPYYHLKTGAFLTQATARPFLSKIRETYSTAFIVADEIDVSEVLLFQ